MTVAGISQALAYTTFAATTDSTDNSGKLEPTSNATTAAAKDDPDLDLFLQDLDSYINSYDVKPKRMRKPRRSGVSEIFATRIIGLQNNSMNTKEAASKLSTTATALTTVPAKTESMETSGKLKQNPNGFVYIEINEQLVVNQLIPRLQPQHSDFVRSPNFNGKDGVGYHISVITPHEFSQLKKPPVLPSEDIPFRINTSYYKILEPKYWRAVARVACFVIENDFLKTFRKSSGLALLPNANHELHVTVGVWLDTTFSKPNVNSTPQPPNATAASQTSPSQNDDLDRKESAAKKVMK